MICFHSTLKWKICAFFIIWCFSLLGQKFNPDFLRNMRDIAAVSFNNKKNSAIKRAEIQGFEKNFTDSGEITYELIELGESIPKYFFTHNAGGAALIKTSDLYLGGSAGYNLSGIGNILGIWDAGRVRREHQEFGSRVTQIDNAPNNHNHATHVAGTMLASGINSLAKGMSYDAELWAYDWNNDTGEMANAALNGLEISQHSYGYVTGWHHGSWSGQSGWHWFGDALISANEDYYFGYYGETAQEWDILAYNAPDYLISTSAGNDRGQGPSVGTLHYYWDGNDWISSTISREKDGGSDGYDCISHRALGKNVITIGAVDGAGAMTSFSSWGPTDDGRIKPDVVAKGAAVTSTGANNDTHYYASGGTSMSGPMVSGSVGIIMEHQQNLHPGQKLTSAMKKGLIIHTANDMIDGNAGPDYRYGWGLMDTKRVIETMTKNAISSQGVVMLEGSLFSNDTINLILQATGNEPIRATLSWTDIPGDVQPSLLNAGTIALVNDLDMRLINTDNVVSFPYVLNPLSPASPPISGDNFRDNVELINIGSPISESFYTLRIHHKNSLTNDQKFALIVTGANLNDCPVLAKAPGTINIQNSHFDGSCILGSGQFLAPTITPCPAGSTIQYRVDGGNWSSNLPVYNQSGPVQTVLTRCSCNSSPDYTSPESKPISTKPNIINSAADSGIGSLRHAINCSNELDTIYYDHNVVDSVMITSTLDVSKSLTILGHSPTDKSKITFDFSAMGNAVGLQLSGINKDLLLSNLILEGQNNVSQFPILNITSSNRIVVKNDIQFED